MMSDDTSAPRALSLKRLLPLLLFFAAALLFWASGGGYYLSFAALAENQAWLNGLVARWGVVAGLGFTAVYAVVTALSLPGASILTVTAGLLFGIWLGTLYAVIGATIGATVIFAAARAGFAGLISRGGPRARRLAAGCRADAFSYLLVLRLIPLFPFWLVNLVAAIAGMKLGPYLLGTFLGIIPGSFIYASLGSGLGDAVEAGITPDLHILFRPSILLPIFGLATLAMLPALYKRWRGQHGSPLE
jgi:uncharacterized membrane protein YdjX (TVP38/TMEM64 family)